MLPIRIVSVVLMLLVTQVKPVPWIRVQSVFHGGIRDGILMQEVVVDLFLILELSLISVLPRALLHHLTTETILDGRVKQRQVDSPLLVWGFSRILLIPHSKQRLVRKIHRGVNFAISVAHKSC